MSTARSARPWSRSLFPPRPAGAPARTSACRPFRILFPPRNLRTPWLPGRGPVRRVPSVHPACRCSSDDMRGFHRSSHVRVEFSGIRMDCSTLSGLSVLSTQPNTPWPARAAGWSSVRHTGCLALDCRELLQPAGSSLHADPRPRWVRPGPSAPAGGGSGIRRFEGPTC